MLNFLNSIQTLLVLQFALNFKQVNQESHLMLRLTPYQILICQFSTDHLQHYPDFLRLLHLFYHFQETSNLILQFIYFAQLFLIDLQLILFLQNKALKILGLSQQDFSDLLLNQLFSQLIQSQNIQICYKNQRKVLFFGVNFSFEQNQLVLLHLIFPFPKNLFKGLLLQVGYIQELFQ
ncbi:hypothetical protein TTHERM_000767539 (macronuclear) [Tetrahymena thermophila SB210]|uniref:Transmembrane protein n=1 Tax=Tetrahymena thermophila (strain SB210) TaxID=312017 RepID=W7XEB9_TETTS|nr:hypothetical protein TTHERM_000767539 [Tetrahymena thermophila SB210]EWS74928.1 hypothetical protein TTHERM_000767539 [Tetrahymena thermophila SB210]|eukprot:XP_012652517.1 hypothetical protein TTHERM_000767539 [Tetrahymena thermophila SB210]